MSEFERSLPMILCSECFSFVLFMILIGLVFEIPIRQRYWGTVVLLFLVFSVCTVR